MKAVKIKEGLKDVWCGMARTQCAESTVEAV